MFIIWTPLKTLLLGLDHHVFIFCVLHIFPSLIWYLSGRNHGFLAVSICAIFDLFDVNRTSEISEADLLSMLKEMGLRNPEYEATTVDRILSKENEMKEKNATFYERKQRFYE